MVRHLVPDTLLAVAAIVFGGTLLLGSGATARLNALSLRPGLHDTARLIAREIVYAAVGAEALVGVPRPCSASYRSSALSRPR